MKKRRILCLVSLICYLLFAIFATALGVSCQIKLDELSSTPQEGLEGLAGIGLGIVMVLAYAYALISLIPILLKAFHLFFDKNVLGILCIPFDVAYIGVHGAATLSAIDSLAADTVLSFLLLLVALLLSVLSLISSIRALREHGKYYF